MVSMICSLAHITTMMVVLVLEGVPHLLGSSLGSSNTLVLSNADYAFIGENSGDYAGIAVSSARDVDGDGLDDLLIGAYRNDDGDHDGGKAYLILGASLGGTSSIDLSQPDYSFIGENLYDAAGVSVSSAGDVDGDGLDDLLIGASGANKAYLILGASLGSSNTLDLSQAGYAPLGRNSAIPRAIRSPVRVMWMAMVSMICLLAHITTMMAAISPARRTCFFLNFRP